MSVSPAQRQQTQQGKQVSRLKGLHRVPIDCWRIADSAQRVLPYEKMAGRITRLTN